MFKEMTPERKLAFGMLIGVPCLIIWLLSTIGCPKPEDLSLNIARTTNGAVVFDFYPKRPGKEFHDPLGFGVWQFWKIDKNGKRETCLWDIAPPSGGPYYLDSLEYGKPPKDWHQAKPPEPMEKGIFYLTAGGIIFTSDGETFKVLPGNYYTQAQIEKRLESM